MDMTYSTRLKIEKSIGIIALCAIVIWWVTSGNPRNVSDRIYAEAISAEVSGDDVRAQALYQRLVHDYPSSAAAEKVKAQIAFQKQKQQEQAVAKQQANFELLKMSLEQYHQHYGVYPDNLLLLPTDIVVNEDELLGYDYQLLENGQNYSLTR